MYITSNNYTVLRISPDGETLDQLYETVSIQGTDEEFIALDKLAQAEDGRLIGVLRHQYNAFLGGNIIEFQAPGNQGDSTIFSELDPRRY